jgi:hypothetical protein
MRTKKLAVLAGSVLALTAVTSSAFAHDRYYRDGYRHGHYSSRVVIAPRPVYVAPAPVYYGPTYYAPAPTYYAPAPVYYGAGPATVGGAIAGAIIGNHIADRHHRGAATFAGALIGGAIGNSIDYSY